MNSEKIKNKPKEYHVDREIVKLVRADDGSKKFDRDSLSYKGAWYTLNVNVDRDVLLTGLDFFGPLENKETNYNIYVKIILGIPRNALLCGCMPFLGGPFFEYKEILPCCKPNGVVKAVKGDIIKMNFPKPVRLQKGLEYFVKFRLEGPETERMKEWKHTIPVNVGMVEDIKFSISGTLQIPRLYFRPA